VIAYIDASVMVRFITSEPDRLEQVTTFDERVTSLIAQVECLRTVQKAQLAGEIDDNEFIGRRQAIFAQLRRMTLVMPSRSILTRTGEPFPMALKALDAIHLATALQWRERRAPDLVFATHDRQLGRAGAALGFPIIGA
jgi:predicted nucleic acid-binding protein